MKTIGKYQVIGELGRSAAGATYRTLDPFRKREFALKVLSPVAALSVEAKDQLYADLAACGQLSHRHIARIRDLGEVDGGVYLATDLVAGSDLRTYLSGQEASIAQKISLIAQVCEGLASAHSKGIAHGGIKPSNILVTENREASILDFGVGTWLSLLATAGARLYGLLPNYLAPEQILDQGFDSRSDIFAAGVMLYEILTGRYPFEASANVIPREIVHTDPAPLRQLNPQLPEELEHIIAQALTKDPQARFETGDEFAANLYGVIPRLRREPAAVPADAAPAAPAAAVEEKPSKEAARAAAKEAAKASREPAPRPWTARSYLAVKPLSNNENPEPARAVETAPAPEPVPEKAAPVPVPVPTAAVLPSEVAEPAPAVAPPQLSSPQQPPPQQMTLHSPQSETLDSPPATATPIQPTPERLVPLKPAIPSPPEQTTRPLPPKGLRKRLITVGIAATLALSLVGIIVSRQFLGASQSGSHSRPATTTVAPAPTPVPAASTPAPVQTEPAPTATPPPAAPVETTQPATDQILRDQILRDQVNPLWEAGRYAAAMRLVDSALASNPASTEARAWKKRIRAAQDAEAAMK